MYIYSGVESCDNSKIFITGITTVSHPSTFPFYLWQAGLDKKVSMVLMSGSDKRSAQC
jgi:hypothetical protein